MNPSLLLIPDRYKASKLYSQIPDSGAGDLAFTRALDTATRVNSEGLIEKVRTNQVLQSETLNDAYWNKINVSITANAIANPLNGALTADLLTVTDPTGPVEKTIVTAVTQSFTAGTPYTASAYFKAGSISTNFRILGFDGTSLYQSGVIDLATIGNSTALYEDVGGGWYRFRFTFTPANTTAVGFVYLVNYAFGVAANAGTNVYIYGAQIETGDIATDYIPTTTAAVSVGPVANIPRIDYTGGGCGKLLLEPQRTNLVQFSESFNNAYWTQSATVTANSTISPSGYQDADTLTDESNSYLDVRRSFTITASTAYTFSIFVKKTTGTLTNYGGVGFSAGGGLETGYAIFNTTTGAVNLADVAGGFVLSAKSTSYGDYYRFEMTFTTGQTSLLILIYPALSTNGTTLNSNAQGANVFYGAQLEAGSYVSSYIPTLGASVTRSADAASKTGISSLIGQTEGTLYAEVDVSQLLGATARIIIIIGTPTNLVRIQFTGTASNTLRALVRQSNVTKYEATFPYATTGTLKVAIGYKSADSVFYVNGTQVASSSNLSFTLPTIEDLEIGGSSLLNDRISAAAIYTTRLSNSELATLTSL